MRNELADGIGEGVNVAVIKPAEKEEVRVGGAERAGASHALNITERKTNVQKDAMRRISVGPGQEFVFLLDMGSDSFSHRQHHDLFFHTSDNNALNKEILSQEKQNERE